MTAGALPCVVLAVALVGCMAKRFEYHSATEIPKGPGMLTGKEGAVVLYPDKNTDASSAPAHEEAGVSESVTADAAVDREFREFQEFKRWKEANRDSPEYREFQEWREWKAFCARKERTR